MSKSWRHKNAINATGFVNWFTVKTRYIPPCGSQRYPVGFLNLPRFVYFPFHAPTQLEHKTHDPGPTAVHVGSPSEQRFGFRVERATPFLINFRA